MRIRTIKPEFWRSDDITKLPRDVRLLFIGLWSYVDDNGVGIDDYRQIAADLFALEDDPIEAREFVRDGLATLSRALLITRYEVAGKPYLFITGWDKHQRIDRPGKPRYPRPDDPDASVTSENTPDAPGFARPSRDSRETLAPGTGEQGNRGTGEIKSAIAIADDEPTDTPKDTRSVERPEVEELCRHLADRIEANGSKRPTVTKRWRDAARLMLDRDGRTVEQIRGAIDWSQEDEFWRANILSMPTLRKQYDRLRLAAQRRAARASPRPSTTDQRIADALEAGRRLQARLDQQHPRLEIAS